MPDVVLFPVARRRAMSSGMWRNAVCMAVVGLVACEHTPTPKTTVSVLQPCPEAPALGGPSSKPVAADAAVVERLHQQLGMNWLAASEETFRRAHPSCYEDEAEDECSLFEPIDELQTDRQCDPSCTNRSHTFEDGVLRTLLIKRSVFDVDQQFASRFRRDAELIASVIERRIGPPVVSNRSRYRWPDIEALAENARDEKVVLDHRVWIDEHHRAEWTLTGVPGHHAGIMLHVEVRAFAEP